MLSTTTRYFYDGVNEIVETDDSGDSLRYYIHGISYVDERLMMVNIDEYLNESEELEDRPYYYTIDRMYNVRFLVDRAGALVERTMYDAYGRPHIRESCGRGDMDNETTLTSTDSTRFTDAKNGTIWDPRADMDDDGDIDANDQTAFDTKVAIWPPPTFGALTVKQAFSDVGNPFMFQGRPHFALDTGASADAGKLMINDHRARKRTIGSDGWDTKDPLWYNEPLLVPGRSPAAVLSVPSSYLSVARPTGTKGYLTTPFATSKRDAVNFYSFVLSNPVSRRDPNGLCPSGQAPSGVDCDITGSKGPGPHEVGCGPVSYCLIDCRNVHENTHKDQLQIPCTQVQNDLARCTNSACEGRVIAAWTTFFGSQCNRSNWDCEADTNGVNCLLGCVANSSDECCIGECQESLVAGGALDRMLTHCAAAGGCGAVTPYVSPPIP